MRREKCRVRVLVRACRDICKDMKRFFDKGAFPGDTKVASTFQILENKRKGKRGSSHPVVASYTVYRQCKACWYLYI